MADVIPFYKPGEAMTQTTSAAVTGGQVLIQTGVGLVGPSTAASEKVVGVAAHDAASGARVTYYAAGGVYAVQSSAAITAGGSVEAASTGRVAPHTVGTNDAYMIGIAQTTVAGADLEVRVQFLR